MTFDVLTIGLFAAIGICVAAFIARVGLKRYEWVVLLVVLAPWISSVLQPNLDPSLTIEQEAGPGGYARIGLVLLGGIIGSIKFFTGRSRTDRFYLSFIPLAVFLLMTLVSTAYSIEPQVTLTRSVSFIAFTGFLLGLSSYLTDEQRFKRVLEMLFGLVLALAGANLLSLVIVPDRVWWTVSEGRFLGLWDHPNTMGEFCMVSYVVCFWKYSHASGKGKWLAAVTIGALVGMHLLTGSRSSLISAMLAAFVWLTIYGTRLKTIAFVALAGVCLTALMVMAPARFQREEVDAGTLTGRPDIWESAYTLFLERPITGYGYEVEGAIFNDRRFYQAGTYLWGGSTRTSLHNGYLSAAIGLGLVGFVVWCVVLALPWRNIAGVPPSSYKAFAFSMMSASLLLNFLEGCINGGRSTSSVFYWISWVMAIQLVQAALPQEQTVTEPARAISPPFEAGLGQYR